MLVVVPAELLYMRLRLPMWVGRSPSTRLFRGLECNIDFNSVTSLRSCEVILTAAIAGDGVATSIIFSASWAKLSSFPVSSVEARTIRTFGSKNYRKSSRRKALSVSQALPTNSLCILLKTVTVSYSPTPRHVTIFISVSVLKQWCI